MTDSDNVEGFEIRCIDSKGALHALTAGKIYKCVGFLIRHDFPYPIIWGDLNEWISGWDFNRFEMVTKINVMGDMK